MGAPQLGERWGVLCWQVKSYLLDYAESAMYFADRSRLPPPLATRHKAVLLMRGPERGVPFLHQDVCIRLRGEGSLRRGVSLPHGHVASGRGASTHKEES